MAADKPHNAKVTVKIAGPAKKTMSDFGKGYPTAAGDRRAIVVDQARYLGTLVNDQSLVPLGSAKRAAQRAQAAVEIGNGSAAGGHFVRPPRQAS